MSDQHNLKEQLCFSLYNAQRQVNRYYSNKVFKSTSNLPTISCINNIMG